MESTNSEEEKYREFMKKVERTVYIDTLPPQANESVLKTGLDQFGDVENVSFIPNYMDPRNSMRCALVEMKDPNQAKNVIQTLTNSPFMIAGMPRPVRVLPAELEMFDDRPRKPGRKITFKWLEADDPDFKVAKDMKRAVVRHATEAALAHKQHLEEEEKLHKQQVEILKANYKKYEVADGVISDGTAQRVAKRYGMRVADE
ncbi:unnamed protein product [Linum tenue]|uniref:RRM domain-containing protein n=1 Tax=Linum tenue TaxID=586396 RepID=A0AAV0QEL9_9ROSI|nr:unnamed protein product [Linum tenue]